jgi:hypothetical protein
MYDNVEETYPFERFNEGTGDVIRKAARRHPDDKAAALKEALEGVKALPDFRELAASLVVDFVAREVESWLAEERRRQRELRRRQGVGVKLGNQAVEALKKIPTDDPSRKVGLKLVADYVDSEMSANGEQGSGVKGGAR